MPCSDMKAQKKTALGSALAAVSGAGIALSAIFGWTSLPRPWGFLLGFIMGILTGIGTALAIHGLIESRKSE